MVNRSSRSRTASALRFSLVTAGLLGGWLLVKAQWLAGPPRQVQVVRDLAGRCTLLPADVSAIDEPGDYCFGEDLTRPRGIEILSDGVTLDLRGHCLHGSGDPADDEAGIQIPYPQRNVTIRNGCVTGFMYGVLGNDGTGAPPSSAKITVTSMRLVRNWFRGVMVAGDYVTVTNSIVADIGGTTMFEDAYAIGIEVRGNHCEIARNTVTDVYPTGSGEGVGISVTNDDVTSCLVAGNVVRNERLPSWGRTFGLWVRGLSTVRHNVMVNHTFSIAASHPKTLSGNLSVGEACLGHRGSLSSAGTDTVYLAGDLECSEDLDVALAGVVKGNRNSLFRVAAIYHTNSDFSNAVVYYSGAASLGSEEAQRQIDLFVELGLVTPDEVAAAAGKALELGLK